MTPPVVMPTEDQLTATILEKRAAEAERKGAAVVISTALARYIATRLRGS